MEKIKERRRWRLGYKEGKIIYFEREEDWENNTEEVVKLVKEFLASHPEVKYLVVASSRGYTAEKMAKALPLEGVRMVAVKLSRTLDSEFGIEFPEERRKFLESKGITVLEAPHTLTGAVDSALVNKFKGIPPTTLIAETLYLFSQGMKVCFEIATMAVDAGLVPEGVDALCVAGTGYGADTCILLQTAGSPRFFDLKVKRILCIPE